MSDGRLDEPLPEIAGSEPEKDATTFAKWLLTNPKVIEVMSISSDLPTVATLETEAELDSGLWMLCRISAESLGEHIISFVKRV